MTDRPMTQRQKHAYKVWRRTAFRTRIQHDVDYWDGQTLTIERRSEHRANACQQRAGQCEP